MNENNYKDQVQSKGGRLTKQRHAIMEIFEQNKKPLSAKHILDCLNKSNTKVDRATVYRNLDFLSNNEFIKKITISDNELHYELIDQPHHHHLICKNCKKIEDVELEELELVLDKKINEINNLKGFQITDHSLELFGKCKDC
jgi:Fur family transcriptional regulator, ferric uptake regulator